MHVIGLTGGIAMGKSNAAMVFARAGVPVFDADATVHRLQARGGAAVGAIAAAFPGTVRDGAVDRAALRQAVLGASDRLHRLEAIIHPAVRSEAERFLRRHRRAGARLVVLDLPLLLETRKWPGIDTIVVVTAPASLQLQRLRRRGRMTGDQIAAVLARQLPDQQRRRAADVVIRTGLSRRHTQRQLARLMARFQ